ncbi:MAG TPA: hypothetical protein VH442_18860 [Micromonosporaceae bacterium]|jgi:hypothetical protein
MPRNAPQRSGESGPADRPGEPDDAPEHPVAERRRWSPNDDILAGFGRTGGPLGLRAFFATTIAASLLVWDLAYSLGAYHTVFYYRLFHIFVASTVLLIGSVVLRKDLRVRPWMRVLLAVPLTWFVARAIKPINEAGSALHDIDTTLTWLTLATVPFTLWALIRIMAPGLFGLPARRLKALTFLVITVIGLTGFFVGQFNNHFTTCHDYVVAGDNEPSDCRPTPGTPAPSP